MSNQNRSGEQAAAKTPRPAVWGITFVLLIAVVVLAPLPFGSDQQWASSLLAVLVGLLLLSWTALVYGGRERPRLPKARTRSLVILFAGVVLWALLQASSLMPEMFHHPVWRDSSIALGQDLPGRIALAPELALRSVLRLLTYAGVFWLALHFAGEQSRARIMLWAVALAGMAYGLYGLIVQLGGYDTILWYDKWGYHGSLSATFVNRSTYATYAGLGLMVSLGLLVEGLLRRGWTGHFRALARALESWGLAPWLLLTNLILLVTALLLSNSKGGLLASAAGCLVLVAALFFAKRISKRAAALLLILVLAGGAGLLAFSGGAVLDRFAQWAEVEDPKVGSFGRATAYGWTVEQIAETPLQGRGLGGFSGTFFAGRDARFGDHPATYYRAHNTYLELALDLGLPAMLALMLILGALLWACIQGLRWRRRNLGYPLIGVAATAVVAVHSLYDFSMEVPGVAVTYLFILGTAVAQSWPGSKSQS